MKLRKQNKVYKILTFFILLIIIACIIGSFIYFYLGNKIESKKEKLENEAYRLVSILFDDTAFDGDFNEDYKQKVTLSRYNHDESRNDTIDYVSCNKIYNNGFQHTVIIDEIEYNCVGSTLVLNYSDINKRGQEIFGKKYVVPKKGIVIENAFYDYVSSTGKFVKLNSNNNNFKKFSFNIGNIYEHGNLLHVMVTLIDEEDPTSDEYYQIIFEREDGHYVFKVGFVINEETFQMD